LAVKQMGNLGGLISGLFLEDYQLISNSLHDDIVEPNRAILIPGFDDIKQECIKAGALGSGISGSGPSMFALSKGKETALKVAETMSEVYRKIGIDFDIHVSQINQEGIKLI
jgi:homoserine kinase